MHVLSTGWTKPRDNNDVIKSLSAIIMQDEAGKREDIIFCSWNVKGAYVYTYV